MKRLTIFSISILLSPGLIGILKNNPCLFLLIIIFSFILIVEKTKNYSKIIYLLFILLAAFQLKTTNIPSVYMSEPAEIDRSIKRVRYYPLKLTKLGYYLELKHEIQYLYKIEENFFDAIDPLVYFPNYFSYLLIPFILYAVIKLAEKKALILLFFALLTLCFTGVHSKYGPIIIFPFFPYFFYLGLERILGYVKK